MNNRDYKQFVPGHYYHVYNRGTGKMEIFRDDDDRKLFLLRLKENLYPTLFQSPVYFNAGRKGYVRKSLPPNSFTLICYCLMPNHFHFLIRQNASVSVGQLISKLSTSYSKYFNKKYERAGTLFQDTFKAILVDNDPYLLWLSAYIHQNPQVAGLTKCLDEYPWSSFLDYNGARKGTLCDKTFILNQFKDNKSYADFVSTSLEKIKQQKGLENYFLD